MTNNETAQHDARLMEMARASCTLSAPEGAVLHSRRSQPRRVVRAAARASSSKPLYACGIDVGTQGTKCLLYDIERNVVAGRGSYQYDLLPQPSNRPNAAEQDPETWMDGIRASLAEALADADADADQVISVGVSGQQHGMVALDKSGNVVRPAKLWCDTESAAQAKTISKHPSFGGWQMQASFTASKVAWLRDVEPLNFEKTKHVLLPHDYINFRLTNTLATEAGDASGLGILDLTTRRYDKEKCAAVDERVLTLLPKDILPCDVQVGKVTEEGSNATGLPVGISVSTGSGDNACAAIGAGSVTPGTLVVSLGTSGTLFGASDTAIFDNSGTIAPFCDALGGYLPLLCTLNCTKVVEEARAFARKDIETSLPSHDSLSEYASQIPPGCDGVQFLPYLVGERTPNWPDASGAVCGLRPGSLSKPGVLYRAAMEGATYTLLTGAEKMRSLGLQKPNNLVCVGGGSKSRLWRQIVANVFDARVVVPVESESAALGAAKQAASLFLKTSTKKFVSENAPEFDEEQIEPDNESVLAYKDAYKSFISNSNKLFD